MTLTTRLGILALALLLPAVAMADPKDDARRHFKAGLIAAEAGQYEVALQHFLAAQDAWPHPSTLYNIAKSYADLDDLPNSLTYYRLFQEAAPDKADDVDPVIAVLEARLGQERGDPTLPGASRAGGIPGGSVGAPGSVVVVGPSEEELARLAAMAAELEALTTAWLERRTDEIAAIESGEVIGTPIGGGVVPGGGDETTTGGGTTLGAGDGGTLEIPEIDDAGLLTGAYERVVVSASRYGQEPLDSPSTVTIITADDIMMSGATKITDVLRRVSGVEVMELTSGHPDVSIRGFNRELNNKIVVLIDGRSTYYDFVGATLWEALPITLEEIERIEVIRGPASAVYGANAVTGIINIITKTPGEGGNIARVDIGTPLYGTGSLLISGKKGNTAYRFSTSYQQHGRWGWDYDGEDHDSTISLADNQTLGLKRLSANGRVDTFFGGQGYASLQAGALDLGTQFYNIGALPESYLKMSHTYLRGDIAYGPVHLRTFWNHDSGEVNPYNVLVGDPLDLSTPLTADTFDVELEGNTAFQTGPVTHRLNGGIGYRYKSMRDFYFVGQFPEKELTADEAEALGTTPNPLREHHFSAFISEEATYDRFKLVATVRADKNPNLSLGKTLSPRGAAIVRIADETALRATGGTAFRAPNFVENYMALPLPTGVDAVYIWDPGDRELLPERIATFELGLHDESTLFHTADIAVYYQSLSGIINLKDVEVVREPFNEDLGSFPAGNSGWENTPLTQTGLGLEAEIELFPVDGLDIYGNVNVSSITETDPDKPDGEQTTRDQSTSLLKINGGTTYRSPYRTDVTFDFHYLSGQRWAQRTFNAAGEFEPVPQCTGSVGWHADNDPRDTDARCPSQLILTTRVAVRPTKSEDLEISATAWNILGFIDDLRYREHPKGNYLGARAYASVRYDF